MPVHQFVPIWFSKSKMVSAIVFLFFLSFFFLFFDMEPCGRKKTLTKLIKLNFLAKLKAENQRVDLNLKTSGTIFDTGLYQHTFLYQHTYYASINIKT